MPLLSVLSNPILPVFAILALGFVLGRTEWISLADARVINRFAMTILIPIVLFDLLANAPFSTFSATPIFLYAAVQATVFASGYAIARKLFGIAPGEAVILAYAGIFVNNVFYALPIAVLLYGELNVLPITMIVVLDSTVSFAGTMIALQSIEMGRASPGALLRIFTRTPALLAIFAGLAWGGFVLDVPPPLQTFMDFNGQAAAPVALFALGVVLSQSRFQPDRAVATFAAIKVFAFPAAIAGAMLLFLPGGWETSQRFVFGAAGPAGAMAFSLAVLHGISTDRIAQVLIWTSVLSLFTLAALA